MMVYNNVDINIIISEISIINGSTFVRMVLFLIIKLSKSVSIMYSMEKLIMLMILKISELIISTAIIPVKSMGITADIIEIKQMLNCSLWLKAVYIFRSESC